MYDLVEYIENYIKFDNEEDKELFMSLGVIFSENLEDNVQMTPKELELMTDIKSKDWNKFLTNKSISQWLESKINSLADISYRRAIMGTIKEQSENNKSTNLNTLAKITESNKKTENNIRLIITRVPAKDDNTKD